MRPTRLRQSVVLLALAAAATRPAGAQGRAPTADAVLGRWQGTLQTGALSLRLALSIVRDSAGGLAATMISIDQQGAHVPATVALRGDSVDVEIATASARYLAVLSPGRDSLRGQFVQGGRALPLALARLGTGEPVAVAAPLVRPQTPRPPYPYHDLEVAFESAPGVRLAGTLSVPEGAGPFPTVVFVTGSGPQDRNETLLGHQPFLVIADHLARHGIASLRYDDRGVARSTGQFASATTADFADDAQAAVHFLRGRADVARDRIGILGHSEGGLVAPMVAARTTEVAFLVLLAGPGVRGDSLLVLQTRALLAGAGVPSVRIEQVARINGAVYAALAAARDSADAVQRVDATLPGALAGLEPAERASIAASIRGNPVMYGAWYRGLLATDPAATLRRVHVPVLALNGMLDQQVPWQPDLTAIDAALRAGGTRDVETVPMPGLNHLFQTAATGGPGEYGTITETIAPAVLDRITSWITARFVR